MVMKSIVRRRPGEEDEPFFARRVAIYTEFDPNSGCHLWSSTTDREGYPRISHKGRPISVLRKMLNPPKDLYLLHSCDTPQCINPNHLRAGTHLDNMRDLASRNRSRTMQPRKRSTEEDRQKIERNLGLSNRSLSRITGLSPRTVSSIKAKKIGRPWKPLTTKGTAE